MSQLTFQIRGYCEAQVGRASAVTQLTALEAEFTRDQSSQNQWCQPLVASTVITFIILVRVCQELYTLSLTPTIALQGGWILGVSLMRKDKEVCLTCPNPKSITELGV